MRHPLWILNSNFLAVFCLAVLFIFFSWQELPEREDIEFTVPSVSMQQKSISATKISFRQKIQKMVRRRRAVPLPQKKAKRRSNMMADDAAEGFDAFLEKRPAKYPD